MGQFKLASHSKDPEALRQAQCSVHRHHLQPQLSSPLTSPHGAALRLQVSQARAALADSAAASTSGGEGGGRVTEASGSGPGLFGVNNWVSL